MPSVCLHDVMLRHFILWSEKYLVTNTMIVELKGLMQLIPLDSLELLPSTFSPHNLLPYDPVLISWCHKILIIRVQVTEERKHTYTFKIFRISNNMHTSTDLHTTSLTSYIIYISAVETIISINNNPHFSIFFLFTYQQTSLFKNRFYSGT
jgi:hypothetical protein